jgi:hypothetical protein
MLCCDGSQVFVKEQVQLDVQLMGKMSELKHQTDILANTVKDRDRAILKLKEKEGIVAKLQGMMPIFIQEKDKTQREVFTTNVGCFVIWYDRINIQYK